MASSILRMKEFLTLPKGSQQPHSLAVFANSELNYISDFTLVKERVVL